MMPAAGVRVVQTMIRSGFMPIAWVAGAPKSVSAERIDTTPAVFTPAPSITFCAALKRFWKPCRMLTK